MASGDKTGGGRKGPLSDKEKAAEVAKISVPEDLAPGLDDVGAALDGAKPVPPAADSTGESPGDPRGDPRDAPPPPSSPPGGTGTVSGGPDAPRLPETSPVRPLGILDDVFYYLDANRQLRDIKARDHSRLNLQALFGTRLNWLYAHFGEANKDGVVVRWKPEKAAEALMVAGARRGVWDAFGRVRGPGAWQGEAGELILHCGDKVWQGPPPETARAAIEAGGPPPAGQWHEPGELDSPLAGPQVYPAHPPAPRPWAEPVAGGPEGPGQALLELIATWAWKRGEIDARLLLGWIGAALLGGALKWRPLCWITGGSGTGKSTLHDMIKLVFDDAIISVSDASAAGVWQKLGFRTLPVALDELEAEEDNRQAQNVVRLARQAASGGVVLRGGADHKGSEFMARACFLFSSILIPPMLGQDRNRMAILELAPLPSPAEGGAGAPKLEHMELRELGAKLRRRLCDNWHRFGEVLELYRAKLQAGGHSARGADQLGTLLACADVLLTDHEISTDEVEALCDQLTAAALALDGTESDEARMINWLLTFAVDPWRGGEKRPLGEWLWQASGRGGAHGGDAGDGNKALSRFGCKIVVHEGEPFFWIANDHQGLRTVFKDSHWAGRSGTLGVWVQAARRLPGAMPHDKAVWCGGVTCRGTRIPLEVVLPSGLGPDYTTDSIFRSDEQQRG